MSKQYSGVIKLKKSVGFSDSGSSKMPIRHHFIAGSIITLPISKSYQENLRKISLMKTEELAISKNNRFLRSKLN